MRLPVIIKLLRPQQWAKNGFIFLPLFFNGQLTNMDLLWQCVIAFFAFSLIASSIYCFNDIYDVEADKLHSEKCKRPIASGAISIYKGYVIQLVCLAIAFSILYLFGINNLLYVGGVMLFYYLMNIAYCIKLKHYAIIDTVVIAIGFVLRVFVGGIVTQIFISEWIVLMTFLLALFLAFAKRRDDVVLYQNTGILPRKNTKRYNLEFLNQTITVIATVTIVAYIMYSITPEVKDRFHSEYIYLTSIFVLLGIIRYLQITIVDLKSSNPTKVLMRDRFIQGCIIGWIISFVLIIYCF